MYKHTKLLKGVYSEIASGGYSTQSFSVGTIVDHQTNTAPSSSGKIGIAIIWGDIYNGL